jgi:NTE family protein
MKVIINTLFIICSFFGFSQKVGLVFSGGGATGFAHIGVLKALEENSIPIDFITGTSAGALIGAMYASGYSPLEIEYLATTEEFYNLTQGVIDDKYKYYFHSSDETAEVFGVNFNKDSILQKFLPTNLLNPTVLDLQLMYLLGTNPPKSKQTFDSLFIPFRCVASDITTKQSILFKCGDLSIAVRASMTYPFFISPIKVDGRLLFDGGLYNNFPAQEMFNEFNADFIIGSNVSYNEPPPSEDDIMSQIRNMFSTHSNYTLPCSEGIIIEPKLGDIGTFDFDKIKSAIDIGYQTTLKLMDSIKAHIDRRVSKQYLKAKRTNYLNQKVKIAVTDINVIGVQSQEAQFIKRKIIKKKKNEVLDFEELKTRVLHLYQSEYINSIFPTITLNSDSTQIVTLQITKEKPFRVAIGGHFSSRPVNEGFIEVSYLSSKTTPLKLYANTYFGKFYGSVKLGVKYYLPSINDAYFEPIFVMNRWDYFTSFTTFFEDVKPSFLIVNDKFWGIKYNLPVFSKGKLIVDFKNGTNEYNYYQTKNFTNKDTADYTSLLYYSSGISYIRNNFNRKQFASAGSFLEIKGRYIHGIEHTIPGSTSLNDLELDNTFRNWFYLKAKYQTYFMKKTIYRLGIHLEGYYAFKPFLANYTATILSAEQFNPFPDGSTFFFKDYRSNQYLSVGLMNVFSLNDKLDLRVDAYYYQPVSNIINNNGKTEYSSLFFKGYEMASTSLIYHSRIGPLRTTLNYFGQQEYPLSFQLSFGYIIFNEKGIK